jgi:hypothetical protein
MPRLRSILFYLFLALYLVVTPLAILYALGYQIRPGRHQAWIKTGLISLETEPTGARVFLGASRYRWKTPTMLRDLKPGDYPIHLTLRGYQPWSAVVRVEPEKATILDHLVLLPKSFAVQAVSTRSYTELIPLPEEDAFLLRTGPRGADLHLNEIGRDEVRPLLPTQDVFCALAITRLHRVPDHPGLLLEARSEGTLRYGWRQLDQVREPTLDITDLFPQPVANLSWDVKARNELFTLAGTSLNRLDLDDRALYPGVLSDVRSFALYRNDLYVLDRSNHLYRTSRDGERKPQRLGLAPEESPGARYALHPLNEETVLFTAPHGALFVNREPHALVTRDLQGWLLHPKKPVLLIWDPYRLGRYDFSERDREATNESAGVQWFYESPRRIEQVFWCHETSHLLLAGEGEVELLALEAGGGAPARPLTRYEPGTSIFYSERAGAVYFLESGRRSLMKLQLLARHNLLNLTRPKAEAHAENPPP